MFVLKALKESLLSEAAGIRTTSHFFEISLMGFIQAISKHYRPTFPFNGAFSIRARDRSPKSPKNIFDASSDALDLVAIFGLLRCLFLSSIFQGRKERI